MSTSKAGSRSADLLASLTTATKCQRHAKYITIRASYWAIVSACLRESLPAVYYCVQSAQYGLIVCGRIPVKKQRRRLLVQAAGPSYPSKAGGTGDVSDEQRFVPTT